MEKVKINLRDFAYDLKYRDLTSLTPAMLKDFEENKEKLNDLMQCLVAPSDRVVLSILNLKIKLRDQFNDKCMLCLLRIRQDITDKHKQRIQKLIQQEEDKIKQLTKKNLSKAIYQSFMIEIKIHRMVQRFRERKRIRDMNKKKKAKTQKDQAVMHINDNERLAVEELAIGMKGQLKWMSKSLR